MNPTYLIIAAAALIGIIVLKTVKKIIKLILAVVIVFAVYSYFFGNPLFWRRISSLACDDQGRCPWTLRFFEKNRVKATPHKARLTAWRHIYLHIFRHLAQKFFAGRQPSGIISVQSDEKSDCVSVPPALCGIALIRFTIKSNWKEQTIMFNFTVWACGFAFSWMLDKVLTSLK